MTTTNTAPVVSRRRLYDARVRELVCATSNPRLFPQLNIPKSTLRGWLNGEFRTAVGAESVTRTEIELYAENAKLRQRVRVLQTDEFLANGILKRVLAQVEIVESHSLVESF